MGRRLYIYITTTHKWESGNVTGVTFFTYLSKNRFCCAHIFHDVHESVVLKLTQHFSVFAVLTFFMTFMNQWS